VRLRFSELFWTWNSKNVNHIDSSTKSSFEQLLPSELCIPHNTDQTWWDGCLHWYRNARTISFLIQQFDDVKKSFISPFINTVLEQFAVIEARALGPEYKISFLSSTDSDTDSIHLPIARITHAQFCDSALYVCGFHPPGVLQCLQQHLWNVCGLQPVVSATHVADWGITGFMAIHINFSGSKNDWRLYYRWLCSSSMLWTCCSLTRLLNVIR
jgi:hypothetical protein